MEAAELKLELFRKIDNLSGKELEEVYDKIVLLLNNPNIYTVTPDERNAIEEALLASEKGEVYTKDDVIKESRKKFPNLKFE